jgi:hypothetical protein
MEKSHPKTHSASGEISDSNIVQAPPKSPLSQVFFDIQTLVVCLSFLPIKSISVVLCTLKLSPRDKEEVIKIIIKNLVKILDIPQLNSKAFSDALAHVPRCDVIHTLNHVFLSYVHGVGISRNLEHFISMAYAEYWIDFVVDVPNQPRALADWIYSGYFSCKRYREALSKKIQNIIDSHETIYRRQIANNPGDDADEDILNHREKLLNVCRFMLELLKSFRLQWMNVDARRWGFSYMDLVDQKNPNLYVGLDEADVERLNGEYMGKGLITRFQPFDCKLTSKIKFWIDYNNPNDPLPDPPKIDP